MSISMLTLGRLCDFYEMLPVIMNNFLGTPGLNGEPGRKGTDGPHIEQEERGLCAPCPAGPPGLTGYKGKRGDRGPKGIAGVPGQQGEIIVPYFTIMSPFFCLMLLFSSV